MPWTPAQEYAERTHSPAWWGETQLPEARTHKAAWFPEISYRIDATATLDFAATQRDPRNLSLLTDAALALLATQVDYRSLDPNVNAEVLLQAFARLAATTTITTDVGITMEANTGSDISVMALAGAAFTALERFPSAFTSTTSVDVAMAAIARQLTDITITADAQTVFGATQIDPRDIGIATAGDLGFDAIARQLSDLTATAATGNAFTSAFPSMSAVTQTVTDTGHIPIPYWCRYIDVIVVGGGKGGQAGSLVFEGRGGTRGYNASQRWDRGAYGNGWNRIYFEVGARGNRGAGSLNQAGGNGGATKLWIDENDTWIGAGGYLEANGATGDKSGRSGESMPNTTINGMTLNGGAGSNGDGGQPGAGGGGGSAGIGTRNGSYGGKGGAMVRFSQ